MDHGSTNQINTHRRISINKNTRTHVICIIQLSMNIKRAVEECKSGHSVSKQCFLLVTN